MIRDARLVAAALTAVLLTACSDQDGSFSIDTSDPEKLALGERVYMQHCAACHGEALEGQPNWRKRRPDGRLPAPPHDETGHTWHHTDEELFTMTREGMAPYAPPGYESDMPAFSEVLSDDEIRAVIAYIKTQWPDPVRQSRRDMLSQRR